MGLLGAGIAIAAAGFFIALVMISRAGDVQSPEFSRRLGAVIFAFCSIGIATGTLGAML